MKRLQQPVSSAAKKQTLQWAAWTRQEEESFFTALRQVGKAFFADMVDDKYQYSCDDKDNRVHGWICSNPAVGFWMITPSDEFRTGGPIKQDLTSHVGPTTLSMFFSTHYAGDNLTIKLRDGEPWKKVFGPVLIYLNSVSVEEDALTLWEDAKEQMLIETQSWPYDFPLSEDFPHTDQRGTFLCAVGYLVVPPSAMLGLFADLILAIFADSVLICYAWL
ncbi:TSL-kinase interacting protein 1 [Camellia lanceoleosa]|uniref:TSL-kinase interacting protein 1 n=1 Tax=Camellia lanceoleosa TaxID=1840588 RepID=A0ACC0J5N0_9ERIC|nr:TSL-kinase interacting protein 1 [Camellia lanceoleosa]